MDPRLLRYYERELRHVREMGGEFAREFPRIAGRLGMENLEVADPYVERLLEGFAFLAARVQLKIDAEFPRFTQHMLECVYPHYLAPLPSMTVVQLSPDYAEPGLADGPVVERDSTLRALIGKDEQTACEYRTAHAVRLWPFTLTEAEYLPTTAAVKALGVNTLDDREHASVKAGIRLRLQTEGDISWSRLPLDALNLYLDGTGGLAERLYEQCIGNHLGSVVQPGVRAPGWQEFIEPERLRQCGFTDNEALLPHGPRSFQGYRLLQEYFALPQRFLFIEQTGLRAALARCEQREVTLVLLLGRSDPMLEDAITATNFRPFCTPAINLFRKTC